TDRFKAAAANIESVMRNLRSVIQSAWDGIKQAFTAAVNHFSDAFAGVRRHFELFIDMLRAIFRGDFKAALDLAQDIFHNWWDTLNQFLLGLPAKMLEFGRNLIGGLVDGVKSMVTTAVDAVKGVGNSVISGFKNLLGIESPSKVFYEIGRN